MTDTKTVYPKTTCWSSVQLPIVNFICKSIADEIVNIRTTGPMVNSQIRKKADRDKIADLVNSHVNLYSRYIEKLDDRPKQTYSPEQPNVFFPYVAKAMLEDIIHFLTLNGRADKDIIKMLEDAV